MSNLSTCQKCFLTKFNYCFSFIHVYIFNIVYKMFLVIRCRFNGIGKGFQNTIHWKIFLLGNRMLLIQIHCYTFSTITRSVFKADSTVFLDLKALCKLLKYSSQSFFTCKWLEFQSGTVPVSFMKIKIVGHTRFWIPICSNTTRAIFHNRLAIISQMW